MPPFLSEVLLILVFLNERSIDRLAAGSLIPWNTLTPGMLVLAIFILRTLNITVSTLRVLTVARGQRALAWGMAALSATVFITTVSGVLNNVTNLWGLVAYAAGFATGNVIGVTLERNFPGHSMLRITSVARGAAIAEALRQRDFGVTEIPGHGMHGTVDYLLCFTPRRKVADAGELIITLDPDAFITVENVRQLSGGWQA